MPEDLAFTAGVASLEERLHLEDDLARRAGNKYLRPYSTVGSIYKLVYFIAETKGILFAIAIANHNSRTLVTDKPACKSQGEFWHIYNSVLRKAHCSVILSAFLQSTFSDFKMTFGRSHDNLWTSQYTVQLHQNNYTCTHRVNQRDNQKDNRWITQKSSFGQMLSSFIGV